MKELEKEIKKAKELEEKGHKLYLKNGRKVDYEFWLNRLNYLKGLLVAKELIEKESDK